MAIQDAWHIAKMILPALVLIVAGLLVGVIAEQIIFSRLRKITLATRWEGGEIIIAAIQGTVKFWCVVAGLHVLVSKQVKQGHYIKLNTGEEGYVTDITWRNTTLRALANNMIIIPNAKMASAIITNYHLPVKEVTLTVPVGVSYGSDLAKVEQVTVQAAEEVMQEVGTAAPGSKPQLRYQGFGDSGINFNVVLKAPEFADQYVLKHELIKKLDRRYRDEGIEIPFPTRTVYVQGEKRDLSKN